MGIVIINHIFFKTESLSGFDEWALWGLMNAVAVVVLMVIGIGAAHLLPGEINETVERYPIESMGDNQKTTGRFFLGSGYINGEMGYSAYLKVGDHFKMKNTSATNTIIKYVECAPYMEKYQYENVGNWGIDQAPRTRYVFNIPKGSIMNGYKLDLE